MNTECYRVGHSYSTGRKLEGFVSGLLEFLGIQSQFFELPVDLGSMAARQTRYFGHVAFRELEQPREVAFLTTGPNFLVRSRLSVDWI